MLDLTAKAKVDGVQFDGVDLFLYDPHISIDISDDNLKRLANKIYAKGFVVGSVVAPVWPPTGGGSAMGDHEERRRFLQQVLKACRIARKLREFGVRPYGVVRVDSASSPSDWANDPEGNQKRIAETFREACDVAKDFGEKLAAEGEICWGGMHSWKKMVELLEMVDRPNIGFQADMAHTLLYVMGYNAPEDAILPQDWDWSDPAQLDNALKELTAALRPWTIDFHVAQNDATVKGSGSHDKTGRHCLPDDPNGKLDIARHAGFWLRDEKGRQTRRFQHICWDGCMFPNEVMHRPETWNHILAAMIAVRDAHGWADRLAAGDGAPGSRAIASVELRGPAKLPKALPRGRSRPTKKARPSPKRGKARRAKRTAPRRPAAKARKRPAAKARKPARKKTRR
ncbi:MAG TPA: TIM barrel protein [Tepidisphaeraceae bacterium]|nr:TIM barrel protein [Tepidisphaeraceae bacterium]